MHCPGTESTHMFYIVQCRGGSGVCPDDLVTANGGGSQDIFDISGRITNGLTCVQYSRNLTTGVLGDILIFHDMHASL